MAIFHKKIIKNRLAVEFQNSTYVHRTADQVSVGYYCDKNLERKNSKSTLEILNTYSTFVFESKIAILFYCLLTFKTLGEDRYYLVGNLNLPI